MIIKWSNKHYRIFLNLVIYSPHRFKTTVSKALIFLPENYLFTITKSYHISLLIMSIAINLSISVFIHLFILFNPENVN